MKCKSNPSDGALFLSILKKKKKKHILLYYTPTSVYLLLNVAKRAGRGGFKSGQMGLRVKRVTSQLGYRSGQVNPYFSNKFFFFFQLQKQINDNLFRENE